MNGVGFPMGNREEAYDENGNVVGNKQQFRGGGIYSYERLFGISTYYSPDPIFTYHQEQGAETGDYGFPISDPISFSTDVVDQNKIYQDFENGRVEFLKTKGNLPNNASEMQATFTLISPYLIDASEEYEEGFRDHLFESGINVTVNLATGVFASKVFTKILSYIVKKYPKKVLKSVAVKYIPVVGWGILIYSATVSLLDVEELHTACESGSYYPLNVPDHEQASHKYFCGKRDAALILGAIGFTSDRALSALKAKNILGVKGNVARSGKEKLMSFVSDNDMDSFENILSGNPKRRTQFFDDVDGLDEGSLKLLAQDKTILKRLTNDGEVEFYGKIKLNGVKTAEDANRKWSGYNPLPYPENTNILEFEINNSMTDEFVRLHNDSNPNRPWIMRKSDFLFYQDKNTGKINLDTIKQDYQIPNENLIDTVSGYLPQEGDILHEGMINGGISNKLQYEIIMDGNVPIDRFTENTILTNLLP